MRRAIYVGTWFVACFFLWTTTFAAEQVTLTTYYPSPVGDYQAVTTGKLDIDVSGTDDAAGAGQIDAGQTNVDVDTNRVTANSLIFLTVGPEGNDTTSVQVESINAGTRFRVRRSDTADTSNPVRFYWFIVN